MDPKTSKESVIAEGTSCKGIVTSACPVTVSGMIDGELTAPAAVVTTTGRLHGKIRVEQLTSEGQVAGDIEAHTLKLSGQVNDKTRIRAQSLEVKLDSSGSNQLQVSFGAATLEVGPEPSDGEDRAEPVGPDGDRVE
ncbi:MAG TPA: polymer-forming cytoskeletal protein [Deferrisomatales bacterium]|nr:polymer-forming cytoskeletal protein [Deferrisomatales bacterium]